MTWPEYLLAVISWQSQNEDSEASSEPLSAGEAASRIRRARDRVTSR